MGCTIAHFVHTGADNVFTLQLSSMAPDGVITPVDLIPINSMSLELQGQPLLTVNRNAADAPIDWWDADLGVGQVDFMLGAWAETNSVPAGRYTAQLMTYDLEHPNGVVWTSHSAADLIVHITA